MDKKQEIDCSITPLGQSNGLGKFFVKTENQG
jgi:hypothetical protein